MLHSGPIIIGSNSSTPGTPISQFGNFFGELGVAQTPQSFTAKIQRNHQELLEVCEKMNYLSMFTFDARLVTII